MIAAELKNGSARAGEHLQLLRLLASELEKAMHAIAGNNLNELEDSILNQQTLSAQLGTLADGIQAAAEAQRPLESDSIDSDLKYEIHAAQEQLRRLNYRYSILLKHSSRSAALMASLFRSFRGQYQEASGARMQEHTWSCQM
jgi:hypothetical protein